MPFMISGNYERFEPGSLRKLEKHLGIILSPNQPALQQRRMLQRGMAMQGGIHNILEGLDRKELLSLIFLITQFGDIALAETPVEYTDLKNIPYAIEWKRHHFMIPLEILELFSQERLFKEQMYLFALIPSLPKEEKKSWIRWMGVDYDRATNRSIDFEIYSQCRILQKPYNGKSLIQDTQFALVDLWPEGSCEEIDWYYKGLTTFYYSLQELSKREKDPFKRHVIDILKSGKFILKRNDRYSPAIQSQVVSTVEGATPQLRESIFQWEPTDPQSQTSLF